MDVTFSDTSVSWFPIQGWSWDFGDGNGASAQNPAHTYPVEGVYDVSLTIDDGYVSTTATKSGYIRNTRVPMVGFTGQDALFGDTNWFADLTTGIFHDTLTDLQYASEISGFSSQYTEGNWSARQALGPPDVFPDHEDNILAWASLTANGQREFLCLKYPEAKQVNGVIVYETLYPGAIDSIYLRDLSTMQWVLAWSGTAAPQPLIARAFQVDFPLTEFQTDEVRIAINSPAVPYWNEIDAVALVSPADTLISDETTYEWEMGIGGPVFTTKGDVHYAFPDTGSYNVTLTVTNKGLCTDSKTMVVHIRPPVLVTWTGNMNSSWHERDNWAPPFIPGEEIDVIVPDVYPNSFPIVTEAASCRNIELRHAASLIIGLYAELTVTGDCIIDFE
jgi:PKD repeat protein